MSAEIVTLPQRKPRCPDHPDVEPQGEYGILTGTGGFGSYTYCPECHRILSRTPDTDDRLRVLGVSRDAGNNRVLLVGMSSVPSDDDLRSLHDYLREWKP